MQILRMLGSREPLPAKGAPNRSRVNNGSGLTIPDSHLGENARDNEVELI